MNRREEKYGKEEKTEDAYICKAVNSGSLLVIILLAVLFSLLKYRQVKRRRARQLAKKTQKGIRAPAVKYRADGRKCFPTTEQCRQEKKYPNKKPSGRRQKKRKLSQARQRRAVQINKFTVFAMSRRNHYAYEKGYIIKKRMNKMKVAVTYENGEVFQHFGHSEAFKLYEVEGGEVKSSEVVPTNGSGHGARQDFYGK